MQLRPQCVYSWKVLVTPPTSAIITKIRPPCNGRAGFLFLFRYAFFDKKKCLKSLCHKVFRALSAYRNTERPWGVSWYPPGPFQAPRLHTCSDGISRLRARPGQPLKGLPGPRLTFFFRQEASRSRRPMGRQLRCIACSVSLRQG